MALSRDQMVQLYTAGTVTIPAPYPELGLVTLISDAGYETLWDPGTKKLQPTKREFIRVEYRTSPARSTGYELPLDEVVAFFWEADDDEFDPVRDWWLGPEILRRLKDKEERDRLKDGRRGITFVKEGAPVIVNSAMPAAEVISMAIGCAR